MSVKREIVRGLWSGAAFALAFANTAHAQNAQESSPAVSPPTPDAAQPVSGQNGVGDIVVTARRRAESLRDVPISVTAFSRDNLDRIGARDVDDVMRLTPGVQFSRESFGAGNRSDISIRGVDSTVGAGTTGIYLDDTPIQVRNIYFSSSNTYPRLFDVDRIEVLRGPQGTLFGAGSEGGTVRFISPAPDLHEFHMYGRSEIAFTEAGDPSYEAGLSLGVPVIDDKVGLRVSGWYRRDGGWVDRVDLYDPSKTISKNDNYTDTVVARIALTVRPADNLTITPSFFFQDQYYNNGGTYWLSLSDPSKGIYRNASNLGSPGRDRFGLGAVAINWDLGGVDVVSNTSYFKRNSDFRPDYTGTVSATFADTSLPPLPGFTSQGSWFDAQENFTQEVRLQSKGAGSPLSWVIGVFYSRAKQRAQEFIDGKQMAPLLSTVYGTPVTIEGLFGIPLYQGLYAYYTDDHTIDEQLAAFGQVDYKIRGGLTLTAGLRVSKTKFSFVSATEGPYLGSTSVTGATSQTPVTPKLGISYKTAGDGLIYATVSKGFRVGGAQRPAPVTCASDLAELGISQIPRTYNSDSVWSYELGAKGAFFGHKLQAEASVYQLDWKNIQRSVGLINCNLSYIDNLGAARSRGFDLSVTARPFRSLTLGLSLSYTDAKYTKDVPAVPPLFIVRDGDTLGQHPWTVYANAQYDFTIRSVNAYFRGDFSYESRNGNPQFVDRVDYDPTIPRPPATTQVSLRLGGKLDGVDLSVFVDNLLDSKTDFGLNHDTKSSPIYFGGSFRPRTLGLTATLRR